MKNIDIFNDRWIIYYIFVTAPLAKSEDLEENERKDVEVDKQVVIGNEIVQVNEESEKELTVSSNDTI